MPPPTFPRQCAPALLQLVHHPSAQGTGLQKVPPTHLLALSIESIHIEVQDHPLAVWLPSACFWVTILLLPIQPFLLFAFDPLLHAVWQRCRWLKSS